ncbi:O-acetyl-ADP-ribose deacetylase macrod1 [Mortierella alpina]|uniref:O-acetyl-ADP-ribose deacetylase macrod1 n=1 Tax=Mortierella alpina TaxID=64518 RepID=A0A9P6J4T7_MORAP|nr:O-acetyl-ADP-ribose deacetylase macrod1 [Mortierella alpina]
MSRKQLVTLADIPTLLACYDTYPEPTEYVIHTVGPQGEKPGLLKSCYKRVLEVARKNDLNSVAFCCISTGIYGYDNKKAAHVALQTVRDWMDTNPTEAEKMARIIFCTFLEKDRDIYQALLPVYFPKASNVDIVSAEDS